MDVAVKNAARSLILAGTTAPLTAAEVVPTAPQVQALAVKAASRIAVSLPADPQAPSTLIIVVTVVVPVAVNPVPGPLPVVPVVINPVPPRPVVPVVVTPVPPLPSATQMVALTAAVPLLNVTPTAVIVPLLDMTTTAPQAVTVPPVPTLPVAVKIVVLFTFVRPLLHLPLLLVAMEVVVVTPVRRALMAAGAKLR